MRRTFMVATLAAIGGFGLASVTSWASLRLNIWQQSGPSFQSGYVVGYLDAVQLAQRKDIRMQIPTGGGKNFDRWVHDVNVFYEDPANANRQLPDAMYEIGVRIRTQILRDYNLKNQQRPVASPSAAP